MDVTNKSCSFDLFTLENNSGQVDDGALNKLFLIYNSLFILFNTTKPCTVQSHSPT